MEKKKADYVLNKFQKIGLSNVHMDEIWNVFGTIKGSGDGPRVMLAAHTELSLIHILNQAVRIYIAQKRKISVGDKMAGRHGNKGVVCLLYTSRCV